MKAGRIGAIGAAAGLCAGMLVGGQGTAGAAVPNDFQLLAGNFTGDARDELFYYLPGAGTDFLTAYSQDGTYAYQELLGVFTVNGNYKPLVGDFDNDGFDEILWYAPGTTTDYLWNFTSNTTISSVPYTANGTYARPAAGDYTGDGVDDVLWYAPGAAQDYLWDYNPGGGYTSTPRTISGSYIPVVGSFGNDATDDVFWYSPGSAADYLWDYNPGTTTYAQQVFTVSSTGYRPFAVDMFGDGPGNEDIFWYTPGAGPDYTWDFLNGGYTAFAEAVNGEYLATSGDFFGDGIEDIVFENYDRMIVWEHTADARIQWTWDYTTLATAATADASSRSAAETGTPGVRSDERPLPTRP